MRALFIPFDWIASERVFGILPAWQQTEFKVSGPSTFTKPTVAAASRAGLRESVNVGEDSRIYMTSPAKISNATPEIQVSGKPGRVGAAEGDKAAAAQINHY